jgi:uncharacterized protein (TIGR02391 family)
MQNLSSLIPDADVVLALEPEELGLRLLPAICQRHKAASIDLNLHNFIFWALGHPHPHPQSGQASPYPANQRNELDLAIREAWFWLVGQALLIPDPQQLRGDACSPSRRARMLARMPDPSRALSARRLPKDCLHPNIREEVWSLYHRGKFDAAVFEAMKAVEVAVREAAGLTNKEIGTALMRKALDVNTGPLTDKQVELAERQARSDLFAGAIGSLQKSPLAPQCCARRSRRGG